MTRPRPTTRKIRPVQCAPARSADAGLAPLDEVNEANASSTASPSQAHNGPQRKEPQQQGEPCRTCPDAAATDQLQLAPDPSLADEPQSESEIPFTTSSAATSERRQAGESPYSDFDQLFQQWRDTGDPRLRDRLILMHRNLVSYLARKFMDRGELSEDIIQQGLIGLINALDHYDPTRGVRFATFATPTILGEIRRYFRDKVSGIRVPRRVQELHHSISSKIDELTQKFDRSPTYAEIARALNLQEEEVVEALEMPHMLEPVSIEEEVFSTHSESAFVVGDHLGKVDPHLESWGDYGALQAALEKLPEKERLVLRLAYFEEYSQVEIARRMQVSQMYVSRLQRRALAHVRELMTQHET